LEFGFGIEGEQVWEVIVLKVGVGDRKIHHFFRDNSGPISDVTELEVAFQ
jgi:hypothetical protein